jgi:hypothetical protein
MAFGDRLRDFVKDLPEADRAMRGFIVPAAPVHSRAADDLVESRMGGCAAGARR